MPYISYHIFYLKIISGISSIFHDGHDLCRATSISVVTMLEPDPVARLAYASEEMQNDREVVLAAVRHEGTMLQYSSGRGGAVESVWENEIKRIETEMLNI